MCPTGLIKFGEQIIPYHLDKEVLHSVLRIGLTQPEIAGVAVEGGVILGAKPYERYLPGLLVRRLESINESASVNLPS